MRMVQSLASDCGFRARIFFLPLLLFLSGAGLAAPSVQEQIAAVRTQRTEAIFRVQEIVNQPVTRLKRMPGMQVTTYHPGWFHDGAITPGFDTVDIRVTRELPYQGEKYVTSDLNPGEVFLGDELEFNSMTKFFYTTRNVPKKKLAEAEMVEINSLYRVIGRCDQKLLELQNPPSLWEKAQRWAMANKPVVTGIAGGLLVTLVIFRVRKSRRLELEN